MYSSNQNPYAHLVTSSRQAPYLVHFSHLQACSFARIKGKPIFSTCKLILVAHKKSPFFSLTTSFCEHIKPKPILAHLLTYELILCAHQTKTHFCPSFDLQAHSVSTSNQNPFFHLQAHSVRTADQNHFFLLTSSFHELMKPNTIFHNFFSMY